MTEPESPLSDAARGVRRTPSDRRSGQESGRVARNLCAARSASVRDGTPPGLDRQRRHRHTARPSPGAPARHAAFPAPDPGSSPLRRSLLLVLSLVLAFTSAAVAAPSAGAHTDGPEIWHPVQIDDQVEWTDTYGDPRGGGRTHKGVDIMAPQMQPIFAAQSGYIYRAYGGDSTECLDGGYCTAYGYLIFGDDGWSYFYLHLNGDTPGRPGGGCDNVGGAENAFSPRLVDILRQRGTLEPLPRRWDPRDVVRVEQGELIGYVGSSGNAGCGTDHLHFEMWAGHDFKSANDSSKSNPTPYVDDAYADGRYWGPAGPVEPAATDRISGPNRVLTSVALSQSSFEEAETVVLAPAQVYPEALLAAPLATLMEAPVLLAWDDQTDDQDVLDDAVAEEIGRLGATNAVIVGRPERLDEALEEQLQEKAGMDAENIHRLSAPDRYALAEMIAEEILAYHGWDQQPADAERENTSLLPFPRAAAGDQPHPVNPVLALGEHEIPDRGWPDALAASVLAARHVSPVLLTRVDELPPRTREVLQRDGIDAVRLIGGPAAISESIEQEIRDMGHETTRYFGENRYQTSLAVADAVLEDGASSQRVFVATGLNYPDALAAGSVVAREGNALILAYGESTDTGLAVYDWLRQHAEGIERVTAVGGTAAITTDVLHELATHANWPAE